MHTLSLFLDWIDAHAQNEKTMAKNEPYLPKRSHKIKKDFRSIKGDGDIWMEKTASDVYGNTRTFFECVESGVRNWDEPPTGASRVLYAKDKHKHAWIDEKVPP